ncbi:hypothetical protein GO755_34790 [Spirosoma sp. HMF4905]|uniref:Uncharacterized protein n=1 Tax=Spirosoma arboris TaxID=2682092 RepID=A0A7K1SN79_9BACT|nr:DUF6169 family protein [Spirosoma arboris]MVM35241.1 hypothetical protein [Spirosoma arboris]
MNPRSPKERSLSTHTPYPVRVNKDGFLFDTDQGITYQLFVQSNAKVFPEQPFGENCVTLSVLPLRGYSRPTAFSLKGDPRLELTIMDELKKLFQANPLLVIAYSCDLTNELERHRSVTFGRWYRKYLSTVGVLRKKYENPGLRAYGAVLYHESNPYMIEIEEEFSEIFSGK